MLNNVVQHGSACICWIGDVHLAVGELPDNPTIDRAERKVAIDSNRPIAQHASKLCSAEIGVKDKPGALPNHRKKPIAFKLGTLIGSATVLPDNRSTMRLSCRSRPRNNRFPLVGDADGSNVVTTNAINDSVHGRNNCGPDFVDIMLNQAWLGKKLSELLILRLGSPPIKMH